MGLLVITKTAKHSFILVMVSYVNLFVFPVVLLFFCFSDFGGGGPIQCKINRFISLPVTAGKIRDINRSGFFGN